MKWKEREGRARRGIEGWEGKRRGKEGKGGLGGEVKRRGGEGGEGVCRNGLSQDVRFRCINGIAKEKTTKAS